MNESDGVLSCQAIFILYDEHGKIKEVCVDNKKCPVPECKFCPYKYKKEEENEEKQIGCPY